MERVLGKADQWARRYAAKFAPDKFELIYFNNPQQGDITNQHDNQDDT
jgi:hypothetical protein